MKLHIFLANIAFLVYLQAPTCQVTKETHRGKAVNTFLHALVMIFTFGPIFTVAFLLLPPHAVLQPIRIQLISKSCDHPWRLSMNFHKFCLNLLYFSFKDSFIFPIKFPQSFSLIHNIFPLLALFCPLVTGIFPNGLQMLAVRATLSEELHHSTSSPCFRVICSFLHQRSLTCTSYTWWSGQSEMINVVNGYLSVVPTTYQIATQHQWHQSRISNKEKKQ